MDAKPSFASADTTFKILPYPLVWPHLLQAVQRQIDAFADADSGSTDKQEGIGGQTIGSTQFLLREWVFLKRKRSRKSGAMAGSHQDE